MSPLPLPSLEGDGRPRCRVAFTFTLVDPQRPQRSFSFHVGLDDQQAFQVDAVQPSVPYDEARAVSCSGEVVKGTTVANTLLEGIWLGLVAVISES